MRAVFWVSDYYVAAEPPRGAPCPRRRGTCGCGFQVEADLLQRLEVVAWGARLSVASNRRCLQAELPRSISRTG